MTCQRIGSAIVCSRARPRRSARPPAGQPLQHPWACRWPGCDRQPSQASWGCRHHWFKLPPDVRHRIFLADRKEQAAGAGVRGRLWSVVDAEAQAWIAEQEAKPPRADRRQPELPL